jgi:hypothetical protein
MLNIGSNPALIERVIKLALRGPDFIKENLKAWIESFGHNVDQLMKSEPSTPASKAEVMELVEPILKSAAELASYAQIADIYLFGKKLTPENIVYAFYIGSRLSISREREPTNDERNRIWERTLKLARSSKIGAEHWKELKSRGPYGESDWLAPIKEKARKKFETFLNQKKRVEVMAERSFKSLISQFDEEEQNP